MKSSVGILQAPANPTSQCRFRLSCPEALREDGARFVTTLAKDVLFPDTLRWLTARERRLVETDMTEQVKGVMLATSPAPIVLR